MFTGGIAAVTWRSCAVNCDDWSISFKSKTRCVGRQTSWDSGSAGCWAICSPSTAHDPKRRDINRLDKWNQPVRSYIDEIKRRDRSPLWCNFHRHALSSLITPCRLLSVSCWSLRIFLILSVGSMSLSVYIYHCLRTTTQSLYWMTRRSTTSQPRRVCFLASVLNVDLMLCIAFRERSLSGTERYIYIYIYIYIVGCCEMRKLKQCIYTAVRHNNHWRTCHAAVRVYFPDLFLFSETSVH